MLRRLAAAAGLVVLCLMPAQAQDLITKKQVFELPSFTTQSGRTLKNVKVGWESYGTLNADKSNAILICHFFSGTGHAAGKYSESDKAAGYWDAIIGPGKAFDTNNYFVFSSDTLVTRAPLRAWRKKVRCPGRPTAPQMKRSGGSKVKTRRGM